MSLGGITPDTPSSGDAAVRRSVPASSAGALSTQTLYSKPDFEVKTDFDPSRHSLLADQRSADNTIRHKLTATAVHDKLDAITASISKSLQKSALLTKLSFRGGRNRSDCLHDASFVTPKAIAPLTDPNGTGVVIAKADLIPLLRYLQRDCELGIYTDFGAQEPNAGDSANTASQAGRYLVDTTAGKIAIFSDENDYTLLSFGVTDGSSKQAGKLQLTIENQRISDRVENTRISEALIKHRITHSAHIATLPSGPGTGITTMVRKLTFEDTLNIASITVMQQGVVINRKR